MDPHRLFTILNSATLAGWVLLWLAPRARVTQRLVYSGVFSLLLSAIYLAILLPHFTTEDLRAFNSLEGVMRLFQNPWVMLAGWVHYLAFDLWVGAWIGRDAAARGSSRLLVVPCQVLTLMLGPVGLLVYVALVRRALPSGRP
ncbi:ABA4-like family protein [Nannocystis bainbridge]|uniref:ABA4-like family protein n=1 Tax=Nannocystis bainbridge TaxID=2995303 RepID=A0ABT5DUW0_9BACT|nr:ABA4-like family protein [Nannocystis bainbridge]MDC0717419.1 ABA4-like family protein [Nannocystis bainbridge]